MMARPEKADAAFYAQVMQTTEPVRAGVSPVCGKVWHPTCGSFMHKICPLNRTGKSNRIPC